MSSIGDFETGGLDMPPVESEEKQAERRRIKNCIRRGVLPRYTFARDPRDEDGRELETVKRKKRARSLSTERYSWRLVSTLKLLMDAYE